MKSGSRGEWDEIFRIDNGEGTRLKKAGTLAGSVPGRNAPSHGNEKAAIEKNLTPGDLISRPYAERPKPACRFHSTPLREDRRHSGSRYGFSGAIAEGRTGLHSLPGRPGERVCGVAWPISGSERFLPSGCPRRGPGSRRSLPRSAGSAPDILSKRPPAGDNAPESVRPPPSAPLGTSPAGDAQFHGHIQGRPVNSGLPAGYDFFY